MSKIKIIQIAVAGAGSIDANEFQELYLDDKGRVWYQAGRWEGANNTTAGRKWVSEWKQVELPEEPNDQSR